MSQPPTKDDQVYLRHILECLERIALYIAESDEFSTDIKTQDAVLRNLQVMAESTQRLSNTVKVTQPQVDWIGISGFRNILVHNYLGINLQRVENIIADELPNLRKAVEAMLEG